jgi:hypothetical protein
MNKILINNSENKDKNNPKNIINNSKEDGPKKKVRILLCLEIEMIKLKN